MALTLKQRLSLFSSLLILLLVLVSGVNYYQLSQLEQHIRSQSQRIDTLNDSMLTLRTAQVHFKIQVQEWKNILLRGNNLEAFGRYRQQFDQQAASTDTLLQMAENTLPQLGINDIDITAIRQAMRTLNGEYRLALQGFDPDRADMGREIDQRLRGVDRAANTLLDEASDKLLQHHQQAVSHHDEQQAAQFRLTLIWTGSTLLCLVFASLAILLLLSRQLLREIGNDPRAARKLLARIADGDLRSPPLPAPRGSIQDSINQMSSKLATTLAQVQEASQQLVAAAGQLTDSSQLLAQSSIDTANSVEESASALDEMATSIMLANENTSSTARIAEDAASHAQRGQVIMQETVSRLRDITREIQLVDDIAYKTGLLALNAAIEAARAGDHGKSFAVVAVEVRKLADRSLQIANSIAESTQNNLAQAETASRALQDISSGSDQTSTLVLEISETSRQLADGVSHISQAIQQMNSATQQNASISEELAATAEQVNSMARQLEQHIDSFHLPGQRQQLALTPQLPRLTT